jgi:hypothetical protein
MTDRELIDLMDALETLRLGYAARLTADGAASLESAETVIRGIVTENEALRQAVRVTCQTCGAEVCDDRCSCWALLADALQQYADRDFDTAAQEAAEIWEQYADKERVWSGLWLAERALCPYCGDWQAAERTSVHHPACETRSAL